MVGATKVEETATMSATKMVVLGAALEPMVWGIGEAVAGAEANTKGETVVEAAAKVEAEAAEVEVFSV